MKYIKEILITLGITSLVIFLRITNIFQESNGFANPFVMLSMIIVISGLVILLQRKIDKNVKEQSLNYDNLVILQYIASILIIICHLRPFINSSDQLDLAFNNIITRTCVPLFFMITGYFVAKKEVDNKDYIKNYIKKMLPLYLSWSVIYIPLIMLMIAQNIDTVEEVVLSIPISGMLFNVLLVLSLPVIFLIGLVYFGIYYHLWYFPAIIFSLLVLNLWKKKFKVHHLLIISFILLLFGATETYYGVFPLSFQRILDYYYKIFFTTRNFLFFGLFYVVLGYHMGSQKELKAKFCFLKLIFSCFFLVFEAILLHDTNRLNSNILISCVPLVYYLFISSIYITKKRDNKIICKLRSYSKYYYLVHPMVIAIFISYNIISKDTNPYLQLLIILLTVHILTIFILWLKKKFKKLII